MATVIDEVRFSKSEKDGGDVYKLKYHEVSIQANPETGVISKSSIGRKEADVEV